MTIGTDSSKNGMPSPKLPTTPLLIVVLLFSGVWLEIRLRRIASNHLIQQASITADMLKSSVEFHGAFPTEIERIATTLEAVGIEIDYTQPFADTAGNTVVAYLYYRRRPFGRGFLPMTLTHKCDMVTITKGFDVL